MGGAVLQIHSITQSIFTIFASFTEVDSDGMNMLRESIWVIPSLLVSLMHWSAPVFEEEQAIEDGEQVDQLRYDPLNRSTWRSTNQANQRFST